MEFFMIRTGFYEKVVDLEAQRRAEELQAAKEQLDASAMLRQQQQQMNLPLGKITLYVDVEVNGFPLKAFMDSDAQSTIISKSCAERCGFLRLMDKRYRGIAQQGE